MTWKIYTRRGTPRARPLLVAGRRASAAQATGADRFAIHYEFGRLRAGGLRMPMGGRGPCAAWALRSSLLYFVVQRLLRRKLHPVRRGVVVLLKHDRPLRGGPISWRSPL